MAKAANSKTCKNSEAEQLAVIEFMSLSSSYGAGHSTDESVESSKVEIIGTHCAHVFLVGEEVYKIKRAVSYSYLDMSKLERRRELCVRELELNQGILPEIYLGVVPITREADNSLRLDGIGEPVEWAVHMKRFSEHGVLDNMAKDGQLSTHLAGKIGRSIARYHAGLDSIAANDGYERIEEVVIELIGELGKFPSIMSRTLLDQFEKEGNLTLEKCKSLLDSRALNGQIKRCHGDLHLRNIVMHDGLPMPFDALEFDERMATTDVLYDLAFVLMDLDHRTLVKQANATFNQYLMHSDEANLSGLKLLPLFLFCRAAIRAMTTAQVVSLSNGRSPALRREAWQYLDLALNYLKRKPPVLVAVGGLSGSGKSTMSARLASCLGSPPGAVLLRSDSERKVSLGLEETDTLPESHYTREASEINYELLSRKASLALDANQAVIVDAVFMSKEHRTKIEHLAADRNITFVGVWLDAPVDVLKKRIALRHNDASDATADVLVKQLAVRQGHINWHTVDSEGSEDEVFTRIVQCIGNAVEGVDVLNMTYKVR